jgi:hypothetical protein
VLDVPARIFHESLAAITDMAALPGVLGCRPLRRTVQVRLGTNPAVPRDELPGGTPILFALAALRSVPQAGSQFRDLATAIHEIPGLEVRRHPLANGDLGLRPIQRATLFV